MYLYRPGTNDYTIIHTPYNNIHSNNQFFIGAISLI